MSTTTLKYQIISIDSIQRSIKVKYFTDAFPEGLITNLLLANTTYTPDTLKTYIVERAPVSYLYLKSNNLQYNLDYIEPMVGTTYLGPDVDTLWNQDPNRPPTEPV